MFFKFGQVGYMSLFNHHKHSQWRALAIPRFWYPGKPRVKGESSIAPSQRLLRPLEHAGLRRLRYTGLLRSDLPPGSPLHDAFVRIGAALIMLPLLLCPTCYPKLNAKSLVILQTKFGTTFLRYEARNGTKGTKKTITWIIPVCTRRSRYQRCRRL